MISAGIAGVGTLINGLATGKANVWEQQANDLKAKGGDMAANALFAMGGMNVQGPFRRRKQPTPMPGWNQLP